MICHYLDDVDRQPTSVAVKQQVGQTMGCLRSQDEGTDGTSQYVDVERCVVLSGELTDGGLEVGAATHGLDLQPDEEVSGVGAGELLALREVSAHVGTRPGNGVDESGTIRTGPGDDELVGFRHDRYGSRPRRIGGRDLANRIAAIRCPAVFLSGESERNTFSTILNTKCR
ncbi:hypothetical protein PA08_1839 [Cutibacterium modestum P08]|nr:hypothetical protein PA08_1839 [Cutibacterium modestum P08]